MSEERMSTQDINKVLVAQVARLTERLHTLEEERERVRELLTADCEWCQGPCAHLEAEREAALTPSQPEESR